LWGKFWGSGGFQVPQKASGKIKRPLKAQKSGRAVMVVKKKKKMGQAAIINNCAMEIRDCNPQFLRLLDGPQMPKGAKLLKVHVPYTPWSGFPSFPSPGGGYRPTPSLFILENNRIAIC